MSFVKVAKAGEILAGAMKHVEIGETEICIANVNGTFYAIGDRCGHENARLSRGSLMGTIVTCPMHASQFDVTSGKMMSGPVLELDGLLGTVYRLSRKGERKGGADVLRGLPMSSA